MSLDKNPLELTPEEFEIFVRRFLEQEGGNLKGFTTHHLEKISGWDGEYEFDVTASFEALGATFKVVIECKRYTSKPIERELVQALNQKKASVNAHKAMLFSTSSFRSGAIGFAEAHGIALVHVGESIVTHAVKSALRRLEGQVITNESIGDYLLVGRAPDVEAPVLSQEGQFQAWKINQLQKRLDYLRILTSKGHKVGDSEISDLKEEIQKENIKLDNLLD